MENIIKAVKELSFEEKAKLLTELSQEVEYTKEKQEKERMKKLACELIDKGELTLSSSSGAGGGKGFVSTNHIKWHNFVQRYFY